MLRATWRGSISVGLVTVPVRLYAAVRRRDVRFRELDRVTGQRVRRQRIRDVSAPEIEWITVPSDAPAPDQPGYPRVGRAPSAGSRGLSVEPPSARAQQPTRRQVSETEVARGYEISPGRWVEIKDEDLLALAPERTRTIDVEQFVSRKELDPLYFESAYYVVPDRDRVRPFALLLKAMQQTNKAAICWLVLRSRRHLAALQPRGNLMLLSTLLFADEIVPAHGLEPILPADLTDREIEMAELLVNTLSGPFEPERYRDEYRERVLALIESQAGRGRSVREPELPAAASGIEDLMAALAASVEQARAQRERAARGTTRRNAKRRSSR